MDCRWAAFFVQDKKKRYKWEKKILKTEMKIPTETRKKNEGAVFLNQE